MSKLLLKYSFMFIVLVVIQVLLLNHIQLSGFINPNMYVLFILLLPVSSPGYLILILAFFIGLAIDIFSNSPGLHAASTVFMALFRNPVIKRLSGSEETRNDYPGLHQNGFRWFLLYALIMVLTHHTFLFLLEMFTFSDFFSTLIRSLLSSVFSVFIIVLSQFIIFRE